MAKVIIQNWEESERGWGTRPDGFTIHTSRQQRDTYVAWYYKTFNNASEAPDEYTRTSGDPYEVEVSQEVYEKIEAETAKKHEGRRFDSVHGKARFFDQDEKKQLTDEDIQWRK